MLNLVDLAGSESASAVQTRERRQEGSHINKSLLTLTHIIYKLSELALKKDGSSAAATSHIPYRDSKLTRILQKSLQGNSRISIVCTATPWVGATEETLNTLRFATRAKKVRRAVHVNEVLDERALLLKYKQEIAVLRRKLAEAERKSKVVAVEAAPAPPSSPADSRLRAQIDEAIRNLNRVILNSTLQAEPATTDIKGAAARRGSLGSDSSLLPSPPSTPPRQKAGSMDASTPFFRKLLSMDHDLDRFDHKLGARLERSRSYSAVVPAPSELAAGRGSPAPMSRTRSMDLSPVAAGAGVGLAQVTAPATASATTAPAGGVRTSITSELRSIRAQLATLLSHEGPPPQVMDGPGQAAGPIEGLAQGSTMSSDAMAAYVRVLEQRVEQLEHQVAKYDLEQSVSRADRSFLENLLSEKDKTIREWSDVIEEIELKQQELEDENERLRERLRLYEAGGDGPAAHP